MALTNSFPDHAGRVGQVGGSLPKGIVTYHGTPYDFKKFSSSHIGSGEGAQAYGYGIYLAENPDVAKEYAETLGGNSWVVNGKTVKPKIWSEFKDDGSKNTAEDYAAKAMQSESNPTQALADRSKFPDKSKAAAAVAMIARGQVKKSDGNIYQTEIQASPDEFLDWDKPLNQQSEFVQSKISEAPAVKSVYRDVYGDKNYPLKEGELAGQGLYRALSDNRWVNADNDEYAKSGNNKERLASEYLSSLGIKGIRYLDQGSRPSADNHWYDGQKFDKNNPSHVAAESLWVKDGDRKKAIGQLTSKDEYDWFTPDTGKAAAELLKQHKEAKATNPEQSRNYVIFDPSIIKVTHKNGEVVKNSKECLDEILMNSFPHHAGIPGHQGGSLPAGESDLIQRGQVVRVSYKDGGKEKTFLASASPAESKLDGKDVLVFQMRDKTGNLVHDIAGGKQAEKTHIIQKSLVTSQTPMALSKMYDEWVADEKSGSSKPVDQTQTPHFKSWFGDSKVVDKEGKPLVVYHGSQSGIVSSFKPNAHFGTHEQATYRANRQSDAYKGWKSDFDKGERWATSPSAVQQFTSGRYGDNVKTNPCYLRITNPKTVNDAGNDDGWKKQIELAKKQGFDGLKYKNTEEGSGYSYVAFHPTQIKSAIGNNGRFDPVDPVITNSFPDHHGIPGHQGGSLPKGETADEPVKPGEKAQDFGKKIGGAKKDLWKLRGLNASDFDSMTDTEKSKLATKKEVMPAPDYSKWIADGMSPEIAYAAKKIKDSIAATPVLSRSELEDPVKRQERQRKYVEVVGMIRDELPKIRTVEDIKAMDSKIYPQTKVDERGMLPSKWDDGNRETFSLIGGRKLNDAMRISSYKLNSYKEEIAKTGWPEPQEQWERQFEIKHFAAGTPNYERVDGKFQEVNREKDSWAVVKKGTYRVLGEYDDEKSATDFAKSQVTKAKAEPQRPLNPDEKRVAKDYRQGKDVSGQDILDTFGFRGGEFGNWTNEKDRQQSLNQTYDALHDMADVLSIPPKAVSLNGQLGIAFGARGSGKASAHYESGSVVINLTRTRGAGALAHEWGHALDDYFGRQASGGRPAQWVSHGNKGGTLRPEVAEAWNGVMKAITEKPMTKEEMAAPEIKDVARGKMAINSVAQQFVSSTKGQPHEQVVSDMMAMLRGEKPREKNGDKLEPEFIIRGLQAFGKQPGMTGLSKMSADSLAQNVRFTDWHQNRLDRINRGEIQLMGDSDMKKRSTEEGEYWVRPHEMFARSFESYVGQKLEDRGESSPYLVQGVPTKKSAYNTGVAELDDWQKLYPLGEEGEKIHGAMEHLFHIIKVDNGKVMNAKDALGHGSEKRAITAYHGTKADFNQFSEEHQQPDGWLSKGFYFTTNKDEARNYGDRVLSVKLALQNPLVLDNDTLNPDGSVSFAGNAREQLYKKFPETASMKHGEISGLLKKKGYDGVVYGDMISAFNPNQISITKSEKLRNSSNQDESQNPEFHPIAENLFNARFAQFTRNTMLYLADNPVEPEVREEILNSLDEYFEPELEIALDDDIVNAAGLKPKPLADYPLLNRMTKAWEGKRLLNSFAGHAGRKGEVGGSLPQGIGKDALDGKPGDNTPQKRHGVDQTATPEFKKWFGDSKVVDGDGKPLVVYHGTQQDFKSFEPDMFGKIYFSGTAAAAGKYTSRHVGAGSIVPVYLSMKNPLILQGGRWNQSRQWAADAAVKSGGHDGIIIKGVTDMTHAGEVSDDYYIAFHPTQIKSAIGNNGKFDPKDPVITNAEEPEFRHSLRNSSQNQPRNQAGQWMAGVVDANGAVKTVAGDETKEKPHRLMGLGGQGRFRYNPVHNRVQWTDTPDEEQMHAVDNHLAKSGISSPTHTDWIRGNEVLRNSNPHPTGWPNERIFYHGSPSGEFHGGHYGIHIGTQEAAREALESRIGIRADGKDWDGTREYGKTLLAGGETQKRIGRGGTGYNSGMAQDGTGKDFYPTEKTHHASYSDGTPVDFASKPNLFAVKIKGEMSNTPERPMSDTRANAQMAGQQKKGNARRGYYYQNDGEDAGSISAVVPSGDHLEVLKNSSTSNQESGNFIHNSNTLKLGVEQPTEAMKAAGNYKILKRVKYQGLKISIETPAGTSRTGVGPDGKPWENVHPNFDYGYFTGFKNSKADSDPVDVYISKHPSQYDPIFVIDQLDPETGLLDEHKTILGAHSPEAAKQCYIQGFSDGSGSDRLGGMTEMTIGEFKEWLKAGVKNKPVSQ